MGQSDSASPRRLGVFIADDSELIRERLGELLAGMDGVEVVGQASDGLSAERGIEQTKPDVAILDIQMPGASGIDVLKHLKQGKTGGPSFIIYTDYGLPQYRKACADAGADFFFEKSKDSRILAEAVRMIASNR